GEIRKVQLQGFVVGGDLEDLLVESRRLRIKAFLAEVIRDPAVLRYGLVGLAGADVQVAERIRGVPVARLILHDAHVFRNGALEAALAKQFLRLLQSVFAIEAQNVSVGSAPLSPRGLSCQDLDVGNWSDGSCHAAAFSGHPVPSYQTAKEA